MPFIFSFDIISIVLEPEGTEPKSFNELLYLLLMLLLLILMASLELYILHQWQIYY